MVMNRSLVGRSDEGVYGPRPDGAYWVRSMSPTVQLRLLSISVASMPGSRAGVEMVHVWKINEPGRGCQGNEVSTRPIPESVVGVET